MTSFIETFILKTDADYTNWSGDEILLNLNAVATVERLPPYREGQEPCKVKLINGDIMDIGVSYSFVQRHLQQ